MLNADTIVQVLLPLAQTQPFDYIAPPTTNPLLGSFVTVPFRGRKIIGIVWGKESSTLPENKLKAAISYLALPPLNSSMLALIRWVGDYTLSPYGSVLRMVMPLPPKALEPKKQLCYILGSFDHIRMTAERSKVINLLKDAHPRTTQEIIQGASVSSGVIQSLKRLTALKEVEREIPLPAAEKPRLCLSELSDTQQQAAAFLHQKIIDATHSVTVIDGITGSGKTEVYFAAIAHILTQTNGQVLILLPEISLTSQVLSRFQERFGFIPAKWHSDLSDKARKETWLGILNGNIRLVIGARSALFLPFSSLSLIVVDEEHEGAYKQEEGVLYHARDMAIVRAYLTKIPIILASATPSLETTINIQSGKFTRLHLPSRYGKAVLPSIEVVDMRTVDRKKHSWLSPTLKEALKETLASGQQSLLFLNRRGYAPLTLCQSCGHRMTCPHCSSWMVEHRYPQRLECHHCGYHHAIPHVCPHCNKEDSLVACGPGVERIAEEVKAFMPQARLLLMTKDTITNSNAAETFITSVLKKEVDILIGTQMVAKGHHFPALTLVGVVDADLGLAGGDLRAAERTYQLLHQVGGRAGREHMKGRVILQSYMPDNSIIQALITSARDSFIESEIQSRKDGDMPPFSKLAALIISGEDEKLTLQTAKNFARTAPIIEGVRVLGPAPALLYQLRKKFRYRLLLKAERHINIQKLLRHWLSQNKKPTSIQVKVDIDPYSFF